jgi:hypothetical protein
MWLLNLHFPYLTECVPVVGLVGGEVGGIAMLCSVPIINCPGFAFLRQPGSNVSAQHGFWVHKAITTGSAPQRDRSYVTRYILDNVYVIKCFRGRFQSLSSCP